MSLVIGGGGGSCWSTGPIYEVPTTMNAFYGSCGWYPVNFNFAGASTYSGGSYSGGPSLQNLYGMIIGFDAGYDTILMDI